METKPISGGDINEVFYLKCDEGNFVVKLNDVSKFPGMFDAEANGLQLLTETKSFKIPRVIAHGNFQNNSYLLLEYLENEAPTKYFWEIFAENLVALHKTTNKYFGLDHENYIGNLSQKNNWCKTASEFYISQRLEPQFKMAIENGFHFKNLEKFYTTISEIIPDEVPSLIHGDLWNGNFIVSKKGIPVLIDPAVAFASREMDLAMMQLFGGFPIEVFSNYNFIFPLIDDWKERLPLWQLYYLLVHLNLFGSGYLPQVNSVIKKYSGN